MIREIRKNDRLFPQLAEIIKKEIYPEDELEDILDELQKSGGYPYVQYFVYEEHREILGFISWEIYEGYKNQLAMNISYIAVRNPFQRKGIADELFQHSLRELKNYWEEEGLKVIKVVAYTNSDNEKTKRFLEYVLAKNGGVNMIIFPEFWEDGTGITYYYLTL